MRQWTRQDVLRTCCARRAKAKEEQGHAPGFHWYPHTIIIEYTGGLHHHGAVCRHERQRLRGRVPGRLHPSAQGRARVRDRGDAVHPPDECIDCGACVPACPVEAIYSLDETPHKWANFII